LLCDDDIITKNYVSTLLAWHMACCVCIFVLYFVYNQAISTRIEREECIIAPAYSATAKAYLF